MWEGSELTAFATIEDIVWLIITYAFQLLFLLFF